MVDTQAQIVTLAYTPNQKPNLGFYTPFPTSVW